MSKVHSILENLVYLMETNADDTGTLCNYVDDASDISCHGVSCSQCPFEQDNLPLLKQFIRNGSEGTAQDE